MDAKAYINNTYTILSDISPKNYAKLARNNIDGKLYVLKYLKAYDISIYQKLKNERLSGISNVIEVIESPDGLYIVEEYVEGCDLEEYIEGIARNNTDTRVDITLFGLLIKLLNNMVEIHKLSIIHRDIKPENIMVDTSGNVKLIDFNIAREYTGTSTRDTVSMGTKNFAAPEQYGFFESDPRTDIYGVGATIKYLMEKYNIHSDKLAGFVKNAMAFDPEDRFKDATEAKYFLENYDRIQKVERNRIKADEAKKSKKKFLPPGFRTGNPSHIVIACFANLLMFAYTLSAIGIAHRAPADLKGKYILAIILILTWYILITLFSFNYLDIHKIFKIDTLSGSKKIWTIVAVDLMIIVITVFVGAFLINKV